MVDHRNQWTRPVGAIIGGIWGAPRSWSPGFLSGGGLGHGAPLADSGSERMPKPLPPIDFGRLIEDGTALLSALLSPPPEVPQPAGQMQPAATAQAVRGPLVDINPFSAPHLLNPFPQPQERQRLPGGLLGGQ